MTRSALVIGAGIIGTTTAWYLAQTGFDVTVIERRKGAGLETSFANGGMLTPSQADPWNAPGTLKRLLKGIGHENAPLLLRLGAIPGMAGWGARFLRAARRSSYEAAALNNLRLALYSVGELDRLRATLNLAYDQRLAGTLKIFRNAITFKKATALAAFLAQGGLQFKALTSAAVTEQEPALQPIAKQLVGAIHYPADESGDAFQFTRALAQRAAHAGVVFRFGETVERFHRTATQITAVDTDKDNYTADVYVLAAGSYSHALGRQCGLRLPIYPAKGYSVTVPVNRSANVPDTPIVDFAHKVYITPFADRLRVAGTAEFVGYNTNLTRSRCDNLLHQALDVLPALRPHLDVNNAQRWAGLRPLTVDGPPVIGRTPLTNLLVNAGHGPLGWTLAAGSARITADIAANTPPDIALRGLGYDRFQ